MADILFQGREIPEDLLDFFEPFDRGSRTSVFQIPTSPYAGAHFAVWPEALVKPMILAGTGAKGCCPTCGASYKRLLGDRVPVNGAGSGNTHRVLGEEALKRDRVNPHMGSSIPWSPSHRSHTWHPGCACAPLPAKRCVVLDPFSGSSTTGKVANDLGRDYIGLDANEGYLPLACARLRGDAAPQAGSDEAPTGGLFDLFKEGDDGC